MKYLKHVLAPNGAILPLIDPDLPSIESLVGFSEALERWRSFVVNFESQRILVVLDVFNRLDVRGVDDHARALLPFYPASRGKLCLYVDVRSPREFWRACLYLFCHDFDPYLYDAEKIEQLRADYVDNHPTESASCLNFPHAAGNTTNMAKKSSMETENKNTSSEAQKTPPSSSSSTPQSGAKSTPSLQVVKAIKNKIFGEIPIGQGFEVAGLIKSLELKSGNFGDFYEFKGDFAARFNGTVYRSGKMYLPQVGADLLANQFAEVVEKTKEGKPSLEFKFRMTKKEDADPRNQNGFIWVCEPVVAVSLPQDRVTVLLEA